MGVDGEVAEFVLQESKAVVGRELGDQIENEGGFSRTKKASDDRDRSGRHGVVIDWFWVSTAGIQSSREGGFMPRLNFRLLRPSAHALSACSWGGVLMEKPGYLEVGVIP